jgi:ABC-type branched-subunit amino acid transport system substrate-binding protein
MERKIPWVGPSAGSNNWIEPPNKSLFPVYPLYYTEAKALVRYAVANLGLKKIAIVYQNDDYGKNGVQGAQKELEGFGLKLAAEVPVEVKDADLGPHVMKLRQAEPDAVLLWVTPVQAIKIVGTGQAMKLNPKWLSTSTCSDFPFMMNISKGLWKGVIAATFSEVPESTSPLMLKYKKDAFDKYAAKDERWGVFYTAGILFAEPLVEGIKRAGRDLTRERLVKELEGLKDFKGIGGRISYAPFNPAKGYETRQGTKETMLVECLDNGVAKLLTDWFSPAHP